ncbi:MAG: flagellar basal body-associated FliL family protein [Planctomycetota bacterium]
MAKKQTDKPAKKSPLMTLLKAVAFVSVLVVVEVVAAALLIPSPNETEALARELVMAKAGEEEVSEAGGTQITEAQTRSEDPAVEMELGQFSVTRFDPETDTAINIDCELYATVLLDEQQEFAEQFNSNRNRVRDQVTVTLKSAESAQLADPGLGLIKRRILEKTNRALGKPLVREILITRFNFVER